MVTVQDYVKDIYEPYVVMYIPPGRQWIHEDLMGVELYATLDQSIYPGRVVVRSKHLDRLFVVNAHDLTIPSR